MTIVWKWSLNGNSNAQVWSNGTATNVTWVDWKMNWAWSFNWASSRIKLTNWSISWNSLIMSAIINPNNVTWSRYIISDSWNNYAVMLVLDWILTLYNKTSSTSWNLYSWWIIELNKYQTVTYSYNNIDWYLRWYIDWKKVIEVYRWWNQSYWNDRQDVIWCYLYSWWSGWFFDWKIDEVEIYNNSLSDAEIKNKYLSYNWFI